MSIVLDIHGGLHVAPALRQVQIIRQGMSTCGIERVREYPEERPIENVHWENDPRAMGGYEETPSYLEETPFSVLRF